MKPRTRYQLVQYSTNWGGFVLRKYKSNKQEEGEERRKSTYINKMKLRIVAH
jgi:hypothetical protein